MKCQQLRELLGQYVRGGLDRQTALALEAHAANCPDCEALLLGQTQPVFEKLEAALAAEPSPRLLQRVKGAVSVGTAAASEACQAMASLLSQQVDRTLSRGERREVSSHLRLCASCRSLTADLRRIDRAARKAVRATPPPDLLDRILSRIPVPQPEAARMPHRPLVEVLGAPLQWLRWPREISRRPVAALAATVAIAAGVWLISSLVTNGRLVPGLGEREAAVSEQRSVASLPGAEAGSKVSEPGRPLPTPSFGAQTPDEGVVGALGPEPRVPKARRSGWAAGRRPGVSVETKPSQPAAASRLRVARVELAGTISEGEATTLPDRWTVGEPVAQLIPADFSSPVADSAARSLEVLVSSRVSRRASEPIVLVSLDASGAGRVLFAPERRPEEATAQVSQPASRAEMVPPGLMTQGPRARVEESTLLP